MTDWAKFSLVILCDSARLSLFKHCMIISLRTLREFYLCEKLHALGNSNEKVVPCSSIESIFNDELCFRMKS